MTRSWPQTAVRTALVLTAAAALFGAIGLMSNGQLAGMTYLAGALLAMAFLLGVAGVIGSWAKERPAWATVTATGAALVAIALVTFLVASYVPSLTVLVVGGNIALTVGILGLATAITGVTLKILQVGRTRDAQR